MNQSTAVRPSDNPIKRSGSLFVTREDAENAPAGHAVARFGDATLRPLHLLLYESAIRLQKIAHGNHVILNGGASEVVAGSGNKPVEDQFRCLKTVVVHKLGAKGWDDLTDEQRQAAADAEYVFLNGRCIKNRHGFVNWRVDGSDWQNGMDEGRRTQDSADTTDSL